MATAIAQRVGAIPRRPRRSPVEQLAVRFPLLVRAATTTVGLLRPTNPLRRRLVAWASYRAFAALARGDTAVWASVYTEDAIQEWAEGFVTLGQPARAEGRDQLEEAMREWDRAWRSWDVTLEHLIDLGQAIVVLATLHGHHSTGLELDLELATVSTLDGLLIEHERDFNEWSDGLRASGLDPGVLDRLEEMDPGTSLGLEVAEPAG